MCLGPSPSLISGEWDAFCRRSVLAKLRQPAIRVKLASYLETENLSFAGLDVMSLAELRRIWRTVYRRWHSSQVTLRSKNAKVGRGRGRGAGRKKRRE